MDRRRFLQVSAAGVLGTAAAAALPESLARAAVAPPAGTGSTPTPSITGIGVVDVLKDLKNVRGNPNHTQRAGHAWGLQVDGPMNVYRGPAKDNGTTGGTQFAIFPNAQNFRYTVGHYDDKDSFTDLAFVHGANYDLVESHYDYASWLFGCWAEGNTVYSIAHHEWHLTTVPADGIPFPDASKTGWPHTTRAIKWYKSSDLGRTWQQKVPGDAQRLFAVPEPYNKRKANTIYGWLQPSANIVKEGDYYYFTTQTYNLPHNTIHGQDLKHVIAGFSLWRTSNLESIDHVQFYTGNAKTPWEYRAPHGYQGSLSAQQPHIFMKKDEFSAYDNHQEVGAKHRAAQSIRYHEQTSQWLIFGYQNSATPAVSYGRTATLADPQFDQNGLQPISIKAPDANADYVGDAYMNVFDPEYDPTDQNLMKIGNNPMLVVGCGRHKYRFQRLQIDVA